MTELQAQVAKLIDARNSLEQQLIKVHQAIEDSITANERGARVESHISKCHQLVVDLYRKNDFLLKLAPKTDDPDKFKKELEDWLDNFATRNDHFLEKGRQYIDARKQSKRDDQESLRSKRSSKQSSRLSRSMTASQYQRALDLAKQKTEELVLQSEVTLKIAEQKRQADELQSHADFVAAEQKRRADELRLQAQFAEIAEQQRQKVAEAKLAEAELENMLEADIESTSSVSSVVQDQATRTKQWVSGNEDTAVISATVPRGGSQNVAAHQGAQIFDSFTPVEDHIVTTPIQPYLPPTLDPNYIGTSAVQVVTA